jgi:hypothetical protein
LGRNALGTNTDVPIEYVIDPRPPPFGDPERFHCMISKEGGPVRPRGATAAW